MFPMENNFSYRSFTMTRWLPEYFRRIISYSQMDIEYTFWQMFYLCFHPAKVYRSVTWHKQTKNQWARDDPAFVVILSLFVCVASLAFAIAFRINTITSIIKLLFWSTFIDFIGIGIIISTITWWFSNRYLRVYDHSLRSTDQTVEWLYSFDVHCNSFFPMFLLLYVIQFFLLPLVLHDSFLAAFLGNSLYLVAYVNYIRITFLGFQALPFLRNTVIFLYPIWFLLLVYGWSLLFSFNISIFITNEYFYQLNNA